MQVADDPQRAAQRPWPKPGSPGRRHRHGRRRTACRARRRYRARPPSAPRWPRIRARIAAASTALRTACQSRSRTSTTGGVAGAAGEPVVSSGAGKPRQLEVRCPRCERHVRRRASAASVRTSGEGTRSDLPTGCPGSPVSSGCSGVLSATASGASGSGASGLPGTLNSEPAHGQGHLDHALGLAADRDQSPCLSGLGAVSASPLRGSRWWFPGRATRSIAARHRARARIAVVPELAVGSELPHQRLAELGADADPQRAAVRATAVRSRPTRSA